jgi:hypothetical protein
VHPSLFNAPCNFTVFHIFISTYWERLIIFSICESALLYWWASQSLDFCMFMMWATNCDLKGVCHESRFLQQHFLLACLHILYLVYQDLQPLSLVMGWHFLLQQSCFRSFSSST